MTVIDVPEVGKLVIVAELKTSIMKDAMAAGFTRGHVWTAQEIKLLKQSACPEAIARDIARTKIQFNGEVMFTKQPPSLFDEAPRWTNNAHEGALTIAKA
jgi:hypothetical protein